MTPKPFKFQNVVFAKDQPEYLPLPAHRDNVGMVTTCWQLSFRERFKILFTGEMWIKLLTFNKPLQPILPIVDDPFQESGAGEAACLGDSNIPDFAKEPA